MTPTRARRLASEWHGGQWSNLYQFASSGIFRLPCCLLYVEEIVQELLRPETHARPFTRTRKQERDLAHLRDFFVDLAREVGDVQIIFLTDVYGQPLPILASGGAVPIYAYTRAN